MVKKIGRARNPMIRRVNNLREDLAVTILYGKNTWMDKEMGKRIKDMRPNTIDVRVSKSKLICFNFIYRILNFQLFQKTLL